MTRLHGAPGLSAVCDRGISRSYSLTILDGSWKPILSNGLVMHLQYFNKFKGQFL